MAGAELKRFDRRRTKCGVFPERDGWSSSRVGGASSRPRRVRAGMAVG